MKRAAPSCPGGTGARFREPVVALERRLHRCPSVITLGVKPNLEDYAPGDLELIRQAPKVYYPSSFYADLFAAMGKPTFPSAHNYRCAQDKILQTTLFALQRIPHPRTRFFFGRQKDKILEHFSFPFVAKTPRGSSLGRGVFLIENAVQLADYSRRSHTAYIQQYLPVDRDLRIVVVGGRVLHAYWRLAGAGDFRTNVARGGRILLDAVPSAALDLARHTARLCGWNDVGIDICIHHGRPFVLEANMKYGREGFRRAGLDYDALMEALIADDFI